MISCRLDIPWEKAKEKKFNILHYSVDKLLRLEDGKRKSYNLIDSRAVRTVLFISVLWGVTLKLNIVINRRQPNQVSLI